MMLTYKRHQALADGAQPTPEEVAVLAKLALDHVDLIFESAASGDYNTSTGTATQCKYTPGPGFCP